MILAAALVCALQTFAALTTPPGSARTLTVRIPGARHLRHVPLVARPDGRWAVRADLLATALGGSLHSLPDGHFNLAVPGATLDIADGSGFATTGTAIVPLPLPAWVEGRTLYLPLATVADVLPRVGSGLFYDPAGPEIRLFGALPARGDPELVAQPVRMRAVVSAPAPLAPEAVPAGTDTVGVAPSGDLLVGEGDDRPGFSGSAPGRRRLVVVDAGHGGPDHGMIGPIGSTHPLYEKNITLSVALKVGAALRRRGIDVLQTRTRDTLIALSDRGRIANEHHGDLFLSIHVNAANPAWHDPAAARGFETYFLAEAKTEDALRVERMENEAVRFETGANAPAHDPLDFVIHDMAQNENLRESAELAEIIQRHLGEVQPGPDRGVKQAGFRVLVTAYMPAVLVEIGFGTNAAEARFLENPASQERIAKAIAAATVEYLGRYERRVGTVGP